MTWLLTLHSIVRWLIVLTALAALLRFGLGWLRRQNYDKSASALAAAFSGLMDTQALLGTLFFIINGAAIDGGFGLRYRWEHLTAMLLAVIVAHLPAMWKKRPAAVRYAYGLVVILVSLGLVLAGIAVLPGNRWLTIAGLR